MSFDSQNVGSLKLAYVVHNTWCTCIAHVVVLSAAALMRQGFAACANVKSFHSAFCTWSIQAALTFIMQVLCFAPAFELALHVASRSLFLYN